MKRLPLILAALAAVFLVLAVLGFIEWRKSLRADAAAVAA